VAQSIHVATFAGMKPALYKTNLRTSSRANSVEHATHARDTYLHDGSLRGFKQDKLLATLSYPVRTLHKLNAFDCCSGAFVLPYCATVGHAPPMPCGSFLHVIAWSHDCAYPHLRYDPCTNESFPLAVPAPTSLVSAVATPGTYNTPCGETGPANAGALCNVDAFKGPDQVSYTYTWVDQFGVESPPAPPSTPIRKWDTQPATVTGLGLNPPPNAACVRIYRTSSSFHDGGKWSGHDTTFQLIEELPVTPGVSLVQPYMDSRRLVELDHGTLQTHMDCPPPPCFDMAGTSDNYAFGVVGNTLYTSEKNEPWNWPEKHRVVLPDQIKGIAVYGDVVFLGTTGAPYKVSVKPKVHKDGEFDTEIDVVPFQEKYPCLGKDTMVATPWGAAYVTQTGIVGLKPTGPASLLTRHRIDAEQWMRWAPNTVAWWDGQLVGCRAGSSLGFILDFSDKGEGGDMYHGDFVELTLDADRLHSGIDGRLYYSKGAAVYGFAEARNRRPYTWRSRVYRMDGITNLAAFKISAEWGPAIKFTLYVDGNKVHEQSVSSSRPCWLPRTCRGFDYQFELSGESVVSEVHIAKSINELASPKNNDGAPKGGASGQQAGQSG
jgi:hypothetical protein